MADDLTVTQEDRDAAAEQWRQADSIGELAQAFARHRLSAKLEAEREVVSWLRKLNEDDNSHNHWKHIALQIERGEHRKAG